MYAIVKTGGKQYRVERGQRLLIERLAVEEGADVALQPVLYRSDEVVFDKAGLQTVQVTARVLAHVRGEKLRVFKFKPKRGYKRRTGHRQDLTQIEVTEITHGQAKPVAARSSRAKPVPASAGAPKATRAQTAGERPKTTRAQGAGETPTTTEAQGAGETPKTIEAQGTGETAKTSRAKTPTAKEKPADGS
jgi:large subunit ribosomal protein L21